MADSAMDILAEEAALFNPAASAAAINEAVAAGGSPDFYYQQKPKPESWGQFEADAPQIADLMAENPHNFAALKDDKEEMSWFARAAKEFSDSFFDIDMVNRASDAIADYQERLESGYVPTEKERLQARADYETLNRKQLSLSKNQTIAPFTNEVLFQSTLPFAEQAARSVDDMALVALGLVGGGALLGLPGGIPGVIAGAQRGAQFAASRTGLSAIIGLGLGHQMSKKQARINRAIEKFKAEDDKRPYDESRSLITTELGAYLETALMGLVGTPVTSGIKTIANAGIKEFNEAAAFQLPKLIERIMSAAKGGAKTATTALTKAAEGEGAKALISGAVKHVGGAAIHGGLQGFNYGAGSYIIHKGQEAALEAIAEGKSDEDVVKAATDAVFSVKTVKEAIDAGLETAPTFASMSLILHPSVVAGVEGAKGIASGLKAAASSSVAKKIALSIRSMKGISAITNYAQRSKAKALKNEVVNRVFPKEAIGIHSDTWNAYWTSKGIDPREKAREVFGNYEHYDAMKDGGELDIPAALYAEKIAATEHGRFWEKNSRIGKDTFTAQELFEHQEQYKKDAKEAAKGFEEFKEEIAQGGNAPLSPGQEYAAYLNYLHLKKARRFDSLQLNAWNMLSPAAKAYSDTPEGTQVALEYYRKHYGKIIDEGLPGSGETAQNQSVPPKTAIESPIKKGKRTGTERKSQSEIAQVAFDPNSPMELGWTKERLVKRLGVSEKTAERIAEHRNRMHEAIEFKSEQIAAELWEKQQAERSARVKQKMPEILRELDEDKGYIAFNVLARGALPSGQKVANVKLDDAEIRFRFGDELANQVPGIVKKTGVFSRNYGELPSGQKVAKVKLDDAAEMFGFGSATELISALIDRGDPITAAEARAYGEVAREIGDALDLQGIAEKQWAKIHDGEANAKRIMETVEALSPGSKEAIAEAREQFSASAKSEVESLTPKNVSPGKYLNLAKRQGELARSRLDKGNRSGAVDAHYKELRQSELHKAAVETKGKIEKANAYLSKMAAEKKRKGITKAGNDFIDAFNTIGSLISERYKPTGKTQAELQGMLDSVYLQSGVRIAPPSVPTNREAITSRQFLDAVETMDAIRAAAQKSRTVEVFGRKLAKEALFKEMETSMAINYGVDPRLSPSAAVKARQKRPISARAIDKSVDAIGNIRYVQAMQRLMDGDKPGVQTETFWRTAKRADLAELKWNEKFDKDYGDTINRHLTKKDLKAIASGGGEIHVPGVGVLNLEDRLGYLLHSGSRHNIEAVTKYNNLTEAQLRQIRDTLEERHIRWAEDYFKMNNDQGFRKTMTDVVRKTEGRTPKWVEGIPIETKYGTIQGGYHRIKYDSDISSSAPGIDPATGADVHYGINPMTEAGATKARSGVPKGAVARTDLGVIQENFRELAHDLAYRETIQNLWSLVKDPRVKHMYETAGQGWGTRMQEWVADMGTSRNLGHIDATQRAIDKGLAKIRRGSTMAYLQLNAATGLSQIANIPNAMKEVGVGNWVRAANDHMQALNEKGLSGPAEIWDRIAEADPRMKQRTETYDIAIKEAIDSLKGKYGNKPFLVNIRWLQKPFMTSLKYFVGLMQKQLDAITYTAGYAKAFSGEAAGVAPHDNAAAKDYAYESVIRSQGTGERIGLPTMFRRGGEGRKAFLQFMAPQLAILNQSIDVFANAARKHRLGDASLKNPINILKAAAQLSATLTIPTMIYMATKGRLLQEDEKGNLDVKKTAGRVAAGALDVVPFVNIPARIVTDLVLEGEARDDLGTVATDLWSSSVDVLNRLATLAKDKKEKTARRRSGRRTQPKKEKNFFTDSQLRFLMTLPGIATGTGALQPVKILSYIKAAEEGRIKDFDKLTKMQMIIDAVKHGASSRTTTRSR